MQDVYKECPRFEDDTYMLRIVRIDDVDDLLNVYADKKAVPFFNSDNCYGDDFYYTTKERMMEAINYWLFEYRRKGFVRWTILSKRTKEAIGTVEIFHRDGDDYFTNCGLLRLDLRSDFEKTNVIEKIVTLLIKSVYTLFQCDKIATKAIVKADERIKALRSLGFKRMNYALIGHDGTKYYDYYVCCSS